MSDDTPLSDEERAELEQLRAKKAAREERERAIRERAELEELRRSESGNAQKSAYPISEQERRREREAQERGRRLMEPGEDLSMPLGQKIVLIALALIIAGVIVTFLLIHR